MSVYLNSRLYELAFQFLKSRNYTELQHLIHDPTTSLTWQNKDGNTVLHIAFAAGNIELLKMLLNSGKSIDFTIKNSENQIPLGLAVHYNKPDILQYVFSLPQYTNEQLGLPSTFMHTACVNRNTKIAQILYERMPSIVNSKGKRDSTPLHIMCIKGDLEMVQLLLSLPEINPNVFMELGETPFFMAVRYNHIAVVSYMLSIPTIIVISRNNQIKAPLDIACYRENEEMIHLLITSGRISPEDVWQLAMLDNIAKDRPGKPNPEGISFSNKVNEILVEYAKMIDPSVSRPVIKERYAPLRIGIKKNIDTAGKYTYAASTHPTCLSDVNLQNLYTRLRIPPRTAILQHESIFINLISKPPNIGYHGAFAERIMTKQPFLGTMSLFYILNGREERHICAYLFMNNILYIVDTRPEYAISNNKHLILQYINENIGINIGLINVAEEIQKIVEYEIHLQKEEVTGYCTMWTGVFLERMANVLPALTFAQPPQQKAIFKEIYDEFVKRPTYGHNFYQELVGRTGGGKRNRKTRRSIKPRKSV